MDAREPATRQWVAQCLGLLHQAQQLAFARIAARLSTGQRIELFLERQEAESAGQDQIADLLGSGLAGTSLGIG